MKRKGLELGMVLVAGLASAAGVYAQQTDCGKNHYILDTPECAVQALDVPIGAPGAIAVTAGGDVYFSVPNLIFKLAGDGSLTRVAGSITPGFAGDGGPATQALLNFPTWYPDRLLWPTEFGEVLAPLALDAQGNLYVGDPFNNRIRKIDAQGIITTVSMWGAQGIAVDTAGNIVTTGGPGPSLISSILPDGRMFMLFAGSGDCGDVHAPGLCVPAGIAIDATGTVYVADGFCRIRKYDAADGEVTFAGDERLDHRSNSEWTCGYSGDGGPANIAALNFPTAVATDALGNVYIADTYNHCIRKVDTTGTITTYAGMCGLQSRIGGLISGGAGYSGDGGPATSASLDTPHGVAVDAAGNVYIADTGNLRIRKVTAAGIITTIAGNGTDLPLQ